MRQDAEIFPFPSIAWFLILAAAAHLCLSRVKLGRLYPPSFADRSHSSEILVERYVEPQDRPVVKTMRAEPAPKLKDTPARFVGEFENRVEKETQSPLTGRFQPGVVARGGEEGGGGALAEDGDAAAEAPGARGPRMADLMALGRTPHELPDDIAKGARTVLNTDPVRYASFVNRIADEIYDPWVRFARDAVDDLYLKGKKLDENVYVTKLAVVMDAQGGVQAIQILKSSGVDALDEAPKQAFWEIEPFENPPAQMFDESGQAKFIYEFHFEWKTKSFNILPFRI